MTRRMLPLHPDLTPLARRYSRLPLWTRSHPGRVLSLAPHGYVHGQAGRQAGIRYTIWRWYLAYRRPDTHSLLRTVQRIRGHAFWRIALARQAKGEPLPVAPGIDIPGDALRPVQITMRDALDPATWWAEHGYGDIITLDEWLSVIHQIQDADIADVVDALIIRDAIDAILADAQVMQILSTAWNGQMALGMGQSVVGQLGIVGTFDLRDPALDAFLQTSAGYWVTQIDATTRGQLADALYRGLGGIDSTQALGMPQLARWLQGQMNGLDNALAGMSRNRAYMIAVTETARAQGFGAYLNLLRSGAKEKIWQVVTEPCRICLSNASMGAIPIQQAFPSGHQAPPGHPICRCSLTAPIYQTFDPTKYGPPASGAFDPASWLLSNPQIAQNWPNVPDMSDPFASQRPPPVPVAQWAPLLQFGDLPEAMQQILTPNAMTLLAQTLAGTTQDVPEGDVEDMADAPVPEDDLAAFGNWSDQVRTAIQSWLDAMHTQGG